MSLNGRFKNVGNRNERHIIVRCLCIENAIHRRGCNACANHCTVARPKTRVLLTVTRPAWLMVDQLEDLPTGSWYFLLGIQEFATIRTTWHATCNLDALDRVGFANRHDFSRPLSQKLGRQTMYRTVEKMSKILVVDDERSSRVSISKWLVSGGFEVVEAVNGQEAIDHLYDGISLIVTDLKMPKVDGMELLKIARKKVPHVAVILLTGSSSVESAIEALQLGASDYLTKPVNLQELTVKIKRAIERRELASEIADLHIRLKEKDELYKMIGRSAAMRKVFERIRLVADTDATVLITGESGTGKELVARAVHAHSSRNKNAFLPVNFAAIAESLIESELFGHEAGSFTGANKRRNGVFQAANEGTLFLDEIGELQIGLQSTLLRALENKAIMRVGSQKEEPIDVRMVAATNTDLLEMVAEGKFRKDLYYRLNVVNIALPPLREREEDIPLLVQYFIEVIAKANSRPTNSISPQALECLMKNDWPGNIRELRNTLESVIVMSLKEQIEYDDLPLHITGASTTQDILRSGLSLRDLEHEAIRRALEKFDGKRKESADALGISVRTLQRKIKDYDLEPKELATVN